MNTDDQATKQTEKVINALDYAQRHNLDIQKKDDVKKILEIIDPEHTSDSDIEEFMKLLDNADAFMELSASKSTPKDSKLPN